MSNVPTPGMRCRNGFWKLFFRAGAQIFEFSVGAVSEPVAEMKRLEVALALRTGDWPAWALESRAVKRFLSMGSVGGDALDVYAPLISAEVSGDWATLSVSFLRELRDVAGPLDSLTTEDVGRFLAGVTTRVSPHSKTGRVRSVATRNRMAAVFSRFYRWAERVGRIRVNPMVGIGQMKEPDIDEIAYLDRGERDAVLGAALHERDGVAIWIACYAGLRRSEINRVKWSDVRFGESRLVVRPGKTKRRRVVPLAGELAARLKAVAPKRLAGRVVSWPEGQNECEVVSRKMVDRLRVHAACAAFADRLGWTVFRHTFGSLLAQAGVSIDKISSWMGNGPEVCRRHYAEFIPRNGHDSDIDLL